LFKEGAQQLEKARLEQTRVGKECKLEKVEPKVHQRGV
jgi:hypothetical protein